MANRMRVALGCVGIPSAATLSVALAAALAGCGGSTANGIASKSAAEILAASRTAAEHASSVHVMSKDSQGRLTLTSTLELASDGGRAALSFLGLNYEVIRVGDTIYIKGNPAFYGHLFGSSSFHVPEGAWLKASADTGKLTRFAGLTDLANELDLQLRSTGPLTKGDDTMTISGRNATELKETAKLFKGSLYVAATGAPYPIEIIKRGRESGQTTFTAWNEPITLSAPADAVDLGKLEHEH